MDECGANRTRVWVCRWTAENTAVGSANLERFRREEREVDDEQSGQVSAVAGSMGLHDRRIAFVCADYVGEQDVFGGEEEENGAFVRYERVEFETSLQQQPDTLIISNTKKGKICICIYIYTRVIEEINDSTCVLVDTYTGSTYTYYI